MKEEVLVKFTGDEAEMHRLPAYEATASLFGVTRALSITSAYLMTQRVRRKKFEELGFKIDLVAQRPGSFETLFEIMYDEAAVATYTGFVAGAAANFFTDFIKSMFSRSIGEEATRTIKKLEDDQVLSGGDLAAVVDALEPTMRQAHRSIDSGATNIAVVFGNNNNVVFNEHTKKYVNQSSRSDKLEVKLFSVGSFNANTGYGRAFDYEEGRTIPFQLSKHPDAKTIETLMQSFNQYALTKLAGDNQDAAVAFQYRSVLAPDGRVKKLLLSKVRRFLDEI